MKYGNETIYEHKEDIGTMDFEAIYQSKLTTATEAAKVIQSGDWVDYGWTVTTPVAVDRELAKRMKDLTDVNFRGGILIDRKSVV